MSKKEEPTPAPDAVTLPDAGFILDVLMGEYFGADERVMAERERITARYRECKDAGMDFTTSARTARTEWLRAEIAAALAAEREAHVQDVEEALAERVFVNGALDPNDGDTDSADPADWLIRAAQMQADRLEDWRNREAACCPEDVGFDEYIAALTRRAERAEARVRELEADAARLDWLEQCVVNVRKPLGFGSESIFWASRDYQDGIEVPSDLRAQIDAATSGGGGGE